MVVEVVCGIFFSIKLFTFQATVVTFLTGMCMNSHTFIIHTHHLIIGVVIRLEKIREFLKKYVFPSTESKLQSHMTQVLA